MKSFLFKTRIGSKLFLAYHYLNAKRIGMLWGMKGLCPWCGEDHHIEERKQWLDKLEKLEGEIHAGINR